MLTGHRRGIGWWAGATVVCVAVSGLAVAPAAAATSAATLTTAPSTRGWI